jgi:type IV pilus assembly protein PilO
MNLEMLREIFAVRRRSFGLLAFLVLVDLALVLYPSLWQEPELERSQKAWFAKRDAIARGVDRGVSARYRDAERDLAQFQTRLIDKKDFAAFLSDLFASAKGNSLALKAINYKPTPLKEPGLFSYAITFDVSGKYAGVKSFLADLARLPKMVTLDAVSLGSASPTEESVDLRVQMTVFLKMEGA